MSGDDHGPKAGCNLNQCGIENDEANCPFVSTKSQTDTTDHIHHYVLVCECGDIKPITTSKTEYGITSDNNGGRNWFD